MCKKTCKVCGSGHSNESDFCDFECVAVYKANKDFIENKLKENPNYWGTFL